MLLSSTFSQNLTLQEAFKTVAKINEKPKRTELIGAFCKNVKLLVYPGKAIAMAMHLPYHYSFNYLARALINNLACEVA